jgi:preprotein translocase subunit SecE
VSPVLLVAGALLAVLAGSLVVYRQPVLAAAVRTRAYVREVRAEMRKVTWPGWEDLKRSTLVIVIFVLIVGVIIGVMDWLFSRILIDGLGRLFG